MHRHAAGDLRAREGGTTRLTLEVTLEPNRARLAPLARLRLFFAGGARRLAAAHAGALLRPKLAAEVAL